MLNKICWDYVSIMLADTIERIQYRLCFQSSRTHNAHRSPFGHMPDLAKWKQALSREQCERKPASLSSRGRPSNPPDVSKGTKGEFTRDVGVRTSDLVLLKRDDECTDPAGEPNGVNDEPQDVEWILR